VRLEDAPLMEDWLLNIKGEKVRLLWPRRGEKARILKMAEEKGCLTINGLEMFIHQGAEQFRLWTGLTPPVSTMTLIATQALRNKS